MRFLIIAFLFINIFAKESLKVVVTNNWQPFNMVVDGKLKGIGIDFWKLVAKKADINYSVEIVQDWCNVLDLIKNEKADLTTSTDITLERKKYAVFTNSYVKYPLVIATNNNVGFIFDLNDLKDKKIAIGKDYTAAALMKKHFPGLNYVYTKNIKQALEMVKNNKAFAAVDILPVIAFNINKFEFNDLKIAGQIPVDFHVRFMLSKQKSYLLEKLNQAISEISPKEKLSIFNKYVKVPQKITFSKGEFIFYILMIGSISIIMVAWIYVLKVEIHDMKINKFNKKDYDRLTGVLKYEKIREIIEDKIKHNGHASIVVFDILGFKEINRFYGHHFGDVTLLELISVIKSEIKNTEYIGRIKGGTFIILLNSNCKRAKKIYDKIHGFNFSIVKKLNCALLMKKINSTDEICHLINQLEISKKSFNYFRCI